MDHEASATFRHIKKDMTVAKARKRFAKGLVGTWSIDDMLVGMRLTFREDGSGTMEEWGWDHFHLDPEYVSVPEFQWRVVADRTIDIPVAGRRGRSVMILGPVRMSMTLQSCEFLRLI